MKPVTLKPSVVPYQLKELKMNEKLVIKRSKENFEKEWKWLFDGLPLKHRAKLCSESGISWLQVSFLDHHKKAWSTEKYLLRDLLQHSDDYKKAVESQCLHAMRLIMDSSKSGPEDAFEADVADLMVNLLAKSKKLDALCKKHFGSKDAVKDIRITTDVKVVLA